MYRVSSNRRAVYTRMDASLFWCRGNPTPIIPGGVGRMVVVLGWTTTRCHTVIRARNWFWLRVLK